MMKNFAAIPWRKKRTLRLIKLVPYYFSELLKAQRLRVASYYAQAVSRLVHCNDCLLPIITDWATNFQVYGLVFKKDTTIELPDAHFCTSIIQGAGGPLTLRLITARQIMLGGAAWIHLYNPGVFGLPEILKSGWSL